jgi:acetyltransferase
MGPNTIGLVNAANGFTTMPYIVSYERIRRGGIAYCSQSGFVGIAAQPLEDRAYPISKMCDIGNKCDVNEVDLLEYFAEDPETEVVAMHLEDVKDGRRFMAATRRLTARKPLLIFKAGRSEEGARASASHTGSLAGSEPVFAAALRQTGAIRMNSWQDYWEIPRVFASQPLPGGNRAAVITLTGGAGVVAVDAAVDAGLVLSRLSASTTDRLERISPRSVGNPIDLGPILSVSDDPFSVHEEAIAVVLEDANVDLAFVAAYAGFEGMIPPVVEMFSRLKRRTTKTLAVWIYGMKLPVIEEMSRQLEAQGLATYVDPETAVRALGAAAEYSGLRSALRKG